MRFLMLNWRDPKNPLAGGAERVTLAYLKALAERGHEVYWFANGFTGCKAEETFDGIHFVRGGGMGSSVLKAISWYRKQKPFVFSSRSLSGRDSAPGTGALCQA